MRGGLEGPSSSFPPFFLPASESSSTLPRNLSGQKREGRNKNRLPWLGMQNGSSVRICTRCMHFFARLAQICMLNRCLLTKFLHRNSVGSLLRARCWLSMFKDLQFSNLDNSVWKVGLKRKLFKFVSRRRRRRKLVAFLDLWAVSLQVKKREGKLLGKFSKKENLGSMRKCLLRNSFFFLQNIKLHCFFCLFHCAFKWEGRGEGGVRKQFSFSRLWHANECHFMGENWGGMGQVVIVVAFFWGGGK